MINRVRKIIDRISIELFETTFYIFAHYDKIHGEDGRIYLQVEYEATCNKSGERKVWKSGKSYLSEFMSDDEIIKKAYALFEQTVKHEIMESFKVDNIILFNPHINFEELLKISHKEITRE